MFSCSVCPALAGNTTPVRRTKLGESLVEHCPELTLDLSGEGGHYLLDLCIIQRHPGINYNEVNSSLLRL